MRAWVEIDLAAIERNVGRIKNEVGSGVEVMAVVKSDAYGHGLENVIETIDPLAIDSYAVISIEEAYVVRKISQKPILIMSYLDTKEIADAISEGFSLSLYDKELIPVYERFAQRIGQPARVHLKVETGLNRLGLSVQEATDFLTKTHHFPNIKLEGIFSHLYKSADHQASVSQLRTLQRLIADLSQDAPLVPIHLASSYSLGHFKEGYLDGVRVGLAMYGEDSVLPDLEPAFSCKALVMQVKDVPAGQGISYGHLFTSDKQTKIAVLPIGYAEGLSQNLTGKLSVLIQGIERSVIGQICMNHIIIDVTGLDVRRGEEAVIIGSQKNAEGMISSIRVADVAKLASLRHHEIIVRLGRGLPRVYRK